MCRGHSNMFCWFYFSYFAHLQKAHTKTLMLHYLNLMFANKAEWFWPNFPAFPKIELDAEVYFQPKTERNKNGNKMNAF